MDVTRAVLEQTETTLRRLESSGALRAVIRGTRFPSQVEPGRVAMFSAGVQAGTVRGVPGRKRDMTGAIKVWVLGTGEEANVTHDMAELLNAVAAAFIADTAAFRAIDPSIYFDRVEIDEPGVDEKSGRAIGLVRIEYGYTVAA